MSRRDYTLRIHVDQIIDGLAHRVCPGPCGQLKSLEDFGLRRMKGQGEGGLDLVTDQSWCRVCRKPCSGDLPLA